MTEELFISWYNETSRRHAILSDDGTTAWLYLHNPTQDTVQTGPVEIACFVYNRIEPIIETEVQQYRPSPPPITKRYASQSAVCRQPDTHDWTIVWSNDGESAVLKKDGIPWCFIELATKRKRSKGIEIEGPWGAPWSEEAYANIEWSG